MAFVSWTYWTAKAMVNNSGFYQIKKNMNRETIWRLILNVENISKTLENVNLKFILEITV